MAQRHNWLLNYCLSSHLTQILFLHYLGKQTKQDMCWTEWKNVSKFSLSISVLVWPSRASRLQGLTVMQLCVYQMTFRNVYKFVQEATGEVWCIALSILLSMNENIISMPVFAQWAIISISFIAGSWKTKQLDKVSAKVSKMCFLCYSD